MGQINYDKYFIDSLITYLKSANLFNNEEYQLYTIKHKLAFIATELSLTGYIDESAIYHDTDKLITYGLTDKQEASKLHRKYAKHHIKNCVTDNDLKDCIIDYECARLTKPDKPLNAYNTILKYNPNMYDKLSSTLDKFNINKPTYVDISFNIWNHNKYYLAEYITRMNIEKMAWLLSIENNVGIEEAVRIFYT